VVLESVVEVNDFSELWPSEADTASQVPLILLLSGRVRKSIKKHLQYIFDAVDGILIHLVKK
jgi:hypothetical protein